MSSGYDRRTLLGAGLSGLVAVLTGGYAWDQYAKRHHLRFWPIEVVNESDERVTLDLVVEREDRALEYEVALAPTGDGSGADREVLHGRWMKYAAEWSVRAELDGRRLDLSAAEITDRLEGSGWGTDCAHLFFVVTAGSDLESRVELSDAC